MNSFFPNYFIHAANVLLLIAYSVRDILWLRLFAVGAALISVPYFVLQPTTLWAPLSWSVVFAAINLLQSWRLFMERREVKIDARGGRYSTARFPGFTSAESAAAGVREREDANRTREAGCLDEIQVAWQTC
jgi:hypothetical protein